MKKKCPITYMKNLICSPRKLKKSFSSTYTYFQIESKNKKKSINKYSGIKSIDDNKQMNSNFLTLSREANKFTSKERYIKNKKIQIFNNENPIDLKNKTAFSTKGNQTNIFKNDNHIFYKTTIFRGGKYFFNDEKRNKNSTKKIDKNTPINKMIDYLEENEENLKLYDDGRKRKYLMEEKRKEMNKINSNSNKISFYQNLINKKEEILNLIINNQIKEDNYISENIDKIPRNNSVINLFNNNIINNDSDSDNKKNNNNENNLNQKNNGTQTNFHVQSKNKIIYPNLLSQKGIKKIPLIFPQITTSCNKRSIDLENSLKKFKPNKIKIINKFGNNTTKNKEAKIKRLKKIEFKKKQKSWSVALDLIVQKNLYRKEENKTNIALKTELQKDIKKVDDEINNKQNHINEIENKINLVHLTLSYKNKNQKKNKPKENPIELRLISRNLLDNNTLDDYGIIKEANKNIDIFNLNDRLYYSWYRDKKKTDISKFMKRKKLTEFIMYNKTKEKILKDKIMGDLYKKNMDKD